MTDRQVQVRLCETSLRSGFVDISLQVKLKETQQRDEDTTLSAWLKLGTRVCVRVAARGCVSQPEMKNKLKKKKKSRWNDSWILSRDSSFCSHCWGRGNFSRRAGNNTFGFSGFLTARKPPSGNEQKQASAEVLKVQLHVYSTLKKVWRGVVSKSLSVKPLCDKLVKT